jgi:dTDP-4-amino-4,6-dideoxygalactose transaminase
MPATRVAVPLLDLKAQYKTLREQIRPAVDEVFESQYFIGGPQLDGLEKELAAYCGLKHAIGCSSGTDALLLSLWALGVGPGDEVITSPYTFFATVGSIARLGAHCRFVDIDPATYNLDVGRLEAAITKRTKVILPVHLYGQSVDMQPLMAIAKKHGLPVVEDCAQSIGTRDADGRMTGGIGTVGCWSFFPSKNLGGAGDGGFIGTNDDALAHRIRVMRNHGMEPKYFHKLLGGNFRLDALQAAVLRVKLKHLDAWHEGRRRNAADYRKLFAAQKLPGGAVTLPAERTGAYHIYNQFVIRVAAARRDALVKHLQSNGIGVEIYYPVPCHLQECFASEGWKAGDFPQAERAAKETLALPIYPELTGEQKACVVETIAEFLRG